MRYRALDVNGDFTFCSGFTSFLVNSPDAVKQAVETRLKLWQNEWFLNNQEGTAYQSDILGYNTQQTRDFAIRQRILDTDGVNSIIAYASQYDANPRSFSVQVNVDTIYGEVVISV